MIERLIIAEGDESMSEMGLYVLPLLGSIMLTYAIFNLIRDLRRKEARRVSARLRGHDGMGESDSERAAKESILRRTHEATGVLGSMLIRFRFVSGLQSILEQANLPWSATAFLVNLLGISALIYIGCYFMQMPQWLGASGAASALVLPLIVINFKRKMRLNKFLNQLPDVFDLMGQALRAGHSLANAVMIVGQQLPDPVGTEFARVFHEQNLGIKIEDALSSMAKRVGLLDVRFFVTAVLIQRQTGGDLAEILDNISVVIRDRIKLFGMVKALTAEGRLSGWVLLALPIVCLGMELVVNPQYANLLLYEETGHYMLAAATVSQLLGLAMIRKIVNIKV